MATSALHTRKRHRTMRVRVAKVPGSFAASDTDLRYSASGAFAALLVEWKLAESQRSGVSTSPKIA
jgi:hypothetical protein